MSQQPNVADTAEKVRKFSPALFGIIAICFLLPFVAITCGNQKLFQLKGLDLVTGTELTEDDLSGEFRQGIQQLEEGFGGTTEENTDSETSKVPAEPAAIVALAVAILGLVLGFAMRNEKGAAASAIIGIVGVLALIALRVMFKIEDAGASQEELAQADAVISYKWGIGWWLTLLLFLVQPLLHLGALMRLRGGGRPTPGAPGSTTPVTPTTPTTPPSDPPPPAGGTGL